MRFLAPATAGLFVMQMLAGCVGSAVPVPEERIYVSVYPLSFFATRIVQDDVAVVAMVPSGVASTDWEPSLTDLIRASNARLFIVNGAGLEPWAEPVLRHRHAQGSPSVVAAAGVTLMMAGKYEPGNHAADEGADEDPYVWLDPLRAQEMVDNVLEGLLAAYPDRREDYTERAGFLKQALASVHERYQIGLRQCANRHLFVSHNGFGYLDHRYNLYQHGITSYDREADPTARRIIHVLEQVAVFEGTALFYDPTRNHGVAAVVARETGLDLLPLHPIESLGPMERAAGRNYFGLLDDNLDRLRHGLRCV